MDKFATEDKVQSVNRYLHGNESSSEIGTSFVETAAIFNIVVPTTILVWKKQFETKGFDAVQSRKKGRPSMKKELNKQQFIKKVNELNMNFSSFFIFR